MAFASCRCLWSESASKPKKELVSDVERVIKGRHCCVFMVFFIGNNNHILLKHTNTRYQSHNKGNSSAVITAKAKQSDIQGYSVCGGVNGAPPVVVA